MAWYVFNSENIFFLDNVARDDMLFTNATSAVKDKNVCIS